MNIESKKYKMKVTQIINDYLNVHEFKLTCWLNFYKKLTLNEAISYAALSRNGENFKHPHQQRISNKVLKKFANKLLNKEEEIRKAQNFEKLFDIIQSNLCKGIGPLTVYDTALRIGANLKKYPKYIYVQAGSKNGAQKLLNKRINKRYISKKELPKNFEKLNEFQIENLLCIYKDDF